MVQRLKKLYFETLLWSLKEKFHLQNELEVPRVKKIVINRGVGNQNQKFLSDSVSELTLISGQRGVVTKTKKAIAGFKVRQKAQVGVSVILRGERMYAFLDRLINLALPRIRDFQGISQSSFDGHGNLSLGLNEQLMFPEIEYDDINQVCGMDICLVTTAETDDQGLALFQEFGMPFAKK